MGDPGALIVVGRLAVAIFVILAPTIMFLGLIRGLERLRDDDLVTRWLARTGAEYDPDEMDAVLTVLADGLDVDGADRSTIRCPDCGAANPVDVTFCGQCLAKLA